MQIFSSLAILALGYLLGAIPFGYLLVKLRTGQDVRDVHSGRTGGTNAMRAAGKRIGLLTGALDVLKGFAAGWVAAQLAPGHVWLATLTPLAAIVGHNYSIFLITQDAKGQLHFGGGAGGSTVLGGSMSLWFPSLFIILPIGGLIYYFIGYASVATLSAAVLSLLIFMLRAYLGISPWEYVIYGAVAFALLAWALRPNIKRLLEGSERLHGYRARRRPAKRGARGPTKSVSRIGVRPS